MRVLLKYVLVVSVNDVARDVANKQKKIELIVTMPPSSLGLRPAPQAVRGTVEWASLAELPLVLSIKPYTSLMGASCHSTGKRCGATAQSALGWYRPSVGVPETLAGKPCGVLV